MRADKIFVYFFLAMISAPMAGTFVPVGGHLQENRAFAPFPTLGWHQSDLLAFTRGFENFFSDRLALRAPLIRIHAQLKVGLLRSSTSMEVILGRDGWLFYKGFHSLDYYTSAEPLTPEDLSAWSAALQRRQDTMRAHGINYIVVFAPNAASIYPEYLPPSVHTRSRTRLDQLSEYLSQNTTVRFIDLRPVLRKAKSEGRLYHRTDTHWNDLGAFHGYRAIIDALKQGSPTPGIALDPSIFRRRTERTRGGDLANMLGMAEDLSEDRIVFERNPPLHLARSEVQRKQGDLVFFTGTVVNADGPNLRMVVLGDSFTDALVPFLAEHSNQIVLLWKQGFDESEILKHRPQIVIDEMLERALMGSAQDWKFIHYN